MSGEQYMQDDDIDMAVDSDDELDEDDEEDVHHVHHVQGHDDDHDVMVSDVIPPQDATMGMTQEEQQAQAQAQQAQAAQDQQQAAQQDQSGSGGGEEDAAVARRRAIQAIMRDTTLSEAEKRNRIQNLMSGGRTEVAPPQVPVLPGVGVQDAGGGNGSGGEAGSSQEQSNSCVHYERNCSIVAPCCNRVFGCRVCHDELSPTGHQPLNRFHIREVVCKKCNVRQPASNLCIQCGTQFGEYHCNVCNLWMAQSKKPFHCNECGFCRVGGIESFRHCNECCMCISVNVFMTHNCFRDKYKNNCPVCREDMFSSRQSPQDLPCGHAIHAHCFRKLAGFDYRCPICKKTVVSQQSMAAAWEARARDIAEQPMPPDLQRVVNIQCNDCETKSGNRQWHFLGVQCPSCSSFNTIVEQVVSQGNGNGAPTTEGGAPTTGEGGGGAPPQQPGP